MQHNRLGYRALNRALITSRGSELLCQPRRLRVRSWSAPKRAAPAPAPKHPRSASPGQVAVTTAGSGTQNFPLTSFMTAARWIAAASAMICA